MEQEYLKVEFRGFEPERDFSFKVQSALEDLQLLAPSQSTISLIFEQGKGVVSVTGKVVSSEGVYLAYEFDTDLDTALRSIECKLIDQMESWRKYCFPNIEVLKSSCMKRVS